MRMMRKIGKIALIALIVMIILFGALVVYTLVDNPDGNRLHVSRNEAINTVLSRMELTRKDIDHLKVDLEWEGMGNYPCYYIYFTYRDEMGEDIRVCGIVDGETHEYLGMHLVE